MDDAKDQQVQEMEVLESIYNSDELQVLCRDYPNISVEVKVQFQSNSDIEVEAPFSLTCSLPSTYPYTKPLIQIAGLDQNAFWHKISQQIIEELEKVAEDSVGFPMVFTLVSSLQDILSRHSEAQTAKEHQQEEHKRNVAEMAERERFEGTRVTVDMFVKWHKKFLEEEMAKRDAEIRAKESQMAGRLTGKQLFLRDSSLNFSDLQIMQATGRADIDESLFEEQIDIVDDDEDDEEGESGNGVH